jgi:carboxypeptidase family protein
MTERDVTCKARESARLARSLNISRKLAGFLLLAGIACLAIALAAISSRAQQEASASIVGKITDPSGASLAGVKVTATSPALQVPEVTTETDVDGEYRLLNLPAPGDYKVVFELQGFEKLIRDGVHLSVGFSGRVDAAMKLGEMTQSVEVSGANPVVDTVNTAGGATLQETELITTPRGTGIEDILPMAAGVSEQGTPDVGDSNLANRQSIITYGVVLEPTLDIEGINVATSHDENTAVYFDSYSLGEAEFKTVGNNADVAFPGVDMVAQIKSGGNDFHGDAGGEYENPSFQGNNVTPTLAAEGIRNTSPLHSPGFYDWFGDGGGRIIRDKLWFYGELSREYQDRGNFGNVAFPGTVAACGVEGRWILASCPSAVQSFTVTRLTQVSTKESYQLRPTIKLIGVYQYAKKFLSDNGGSTSVPLPSATYQHQPGSIYKGEVQWTPNSRWLVDGLAGHGGYHVHYDATPGSNLAGYGWTNPTGADFVGDPTQLDKSDGNLTTGTNSGPNDRPQNRFEARGLVSYTPDHALLGGTHNFKFGSAETWEEAATRVPINDAAGDYTLIFSGYNSTTGALSVPNQITLYNYPVTPVNYEHSQSIFATDTWSFRRVTLNYGVRWERYNAFLPSQTKPAGQMATYSDANGPLFPAGTFAPAQLLTWNDFVPRVGAAWDINGNGKTVVKGSFGIFGDTMGDLWGNDFNGNGISSKTYPWTSAQLNGGCYTGNPAGSELFTYDEFQCDLNPAWLTTTLKTLTATSATGSVSQLLNSGLKQPKYYEYMVKLERQLANNFALRVTYVRHNLYYLYNAATNDGFPGATTTFVSNGINVGRLYGNYVPETAQPVKGPVGGTITLYNYPAAAACATGTGISCTSNEVINNPSSRPDTYNTFEIAVEKRYSKRWDALLSFWGTQNHRWLQGTAGINGSPNDDYFPVDDTFNWEARADVSYKLPWGIETDALLRAQSGVYWAPTENFATFTPAGGGAATAFGQGTISLRLAKFGTNQGPIIPVLNWRIAKTFRLGETRKLSAEFQIYNLLNSSAATGFTSLEGSTYGDATGILSPRVARIGGRFEF